MNGKEEDEFKVTWKACKYNMWDNFIYSIFFPWDIITQIAPYFILKMNPRKR